VSKLLRGVTAQLLLLTVLPLALVLVVISFGSIAMHQQAMRDLVGERDLRAVMATANSLGATLQRKLDTLRGLAAGAAALPDPAAGLDGALRDHEALREFPGGIALYAFDGAPITATAAAQAWAAAGVPGDWLQAALPTPPLVAQGAALWLVGQDRDRRITAIGHVPAETLRLGDLVNPGGAGGALAAYLFDSAGRVLHYTGPEQPPADVSAHAGVAEALRGERGVLYQPDAAGGEEHVVSYAPIQTDAGLTGLGILIEEPWAAVLDPMMQYALIGPLISLPVLLLALVAVAFGLRRIVQPLQVLDRQAREIGSGRYDALAEPVRGIQEVEQLHATLQRMAAQIQEDQERLRGYARRVTEAQESERGRLARELHDDTIQNLIVLSQRVQSMRLAADRGAPPGAARLSELRADILRMIEEVRRFSRALRPIYLEEAGLSAAIDRLACEIDASARAGAAVTFRSTGNIPRLKADVELALYRIAQEALSNALRHAGASRIAISLDGADADVVRLRIEDDGQGFAGQDTEPPGAASSSGFGLMGIRERAELIGAAVDLVTAPGQGTRLDVTYRVR
jgi:signal transduction histidine kinase